MNQIDPHTLPEIEAIGVSNELGGVVLNSILSVIPSSKIEVVVFICATIISDLRNDYRDQRHRPLSPLMSFQQSLDNVRSYHQQHDI